MISDCESLIYSLHDSCCNVNERFKALLQCFMKITDMPFKYDTSTLSIA